MKVSLKGFFAGLALFLLSGVEAHAVTIWTAGNALIACTPNPPAGSSSNCTKDAGAAPVLQGGALGTPSSGNGSNLTALNASNMSSGTVPDARFPATLPAVSGVNLTALNASNLGSGTIPCARMPTITGDVSGPSGSCARTVTGLNGTNLAGLGAGILKQDGSGIPSALTYSTGTWTPIMTGSTTAGSSTPTRQIGSYIKIGQLVCIQLRYTFSGFTGGAGNGTITGLPFTAIATANWIATIAFSRAANVDLTTGYTSMAGEVTNNTTIMSMEQMGDNIAASFLGVGAFTGSVDLTASGCYISAS